MRKTNKYLISGLKSLKCYDQIVSLDKSLKSVHAGILEIRGVTVIFNTDQQDKLRFLISEAKRHDEIITDEIVDKYQHAVVFKTDIDIEAFLEGRYSEMFNKNKSLIKFLKPECQEICNKTEKGFKIFLKLMEDNFGDLDDLTKESLKKGEYDIIPNQQKDITIYAV